MTAGLQPITPLTAEEMEAGHSLWQDAWHRLRKNKMAVIGAVFVILLALASILAPLLAPKSYAEQDLGLGATPPSRAHWLGTDDLGRDSLSRILYGGRISLSVGLAATAVSVVIGVLYGTISGYFGKRTDVIMMRIVDIMYSLPFVIFVILLMVVFGDASSKVENFLNVKLHFLTVDLGFHVKIAKHWNIILLFMAIGAIEWLDMSRIVRGQVMSLRKQEFIEAAHALGLRKRRIILRHMIPNVLGIVIVYATLIVPRVMLTEAFLSFLGFGVQPPMSSWGTLINDGARSMEEFPWLLIFPALCFSMTLFSLNFLGDGLRDALDVRASKD